MNIKRTESKGIITCVAILTCLVIASSLLMGFVFPKQITIIDSGSEMNVMTLEKTVGDVLKEKNITLNEGDIISPSIDAQIKDGGTITISRLKKITIKADGNAVVITTNAETADKAVAEAGITLGEFDIFSCTKDAQLKDGMTIEIIRAKNVTLTADGNFYQKSTNQANINDFLLEIGISLGMYDEISPSLYTPISEGLDIVITRVTVGEETYEEPVARNVVNKQSSEYTQGRTIVEQEGSDGVAKNTYSVIRKNGEVYSKTLVNSEVVVAPVDKVVTIGTKEPVIPSKEGVRYKKVLQCTATAYEPGYPGITATGTKAGPGTIAVDPRVIPLGSKLYVESTDDGKSWTYGYAIAADTGGAIKGNKIDLCYNTRSECIQFGRRQCIVYILE